MSGITCSYNYANCLSSLSALPGYYQPGYGPDIRPCFYLVSDHFLISGIRQDIKAEIRPDIWLYQIIGWHDILTGCLDIKRKNSNKKKSYDFLSLGFNLTFRCYQNLTLHSRISRSPLIISFDLEI